ncbi:MAG: TetR/AcrR family transcriptional regulator [Erysipelotrichaceae bacterium]|nr:TetR/AcrR family transcriptional regulator [Erysipelotrichaceae bacterium]
MTTVKRTNYATIRTKKLIRKTFCELIYEKRRIDDITVSELVKKADINRGTFYNHYSNITAVAHEIGDEIRHGLFDYPDFTKISDFDAYYDSIFNYVKENESNLYLLLRYDKAISFLTEMQTSGENFLKSRFIQSGIELNQEIESTISYYCCGIISYITLNLWRDKHIDIEVLAQFRKLWFRKLFGAYQ